MRLDAARITAEIARRGGALGLHLHVRASTGSTNDDARAAARAGAPHGSAYLAEAQTKGRGRGGNVWFSPPGENLYLSVLLRPRVEASRIAPFTLAVGLAVARVVDLQRTQLEARIKWPNDVLLGGKKVAGVLVEGQIQAGVAESLSRWGGERPGTPAHVASLVVGVGLNVGTTRFPADLERTATSLAIAGAPGVDPSTVAADLLVELGGALASFEAHGLAAVLEELRARDALVDASLRVGSVEGRGAGIDAEGRLLVRTGAGDVIAVASGSVERLEGR
jgi:BirA family transcriptional regulator, biotin operon repressor / biotin---[acetyl-CoA-carboxylase] ligase